MASINLALLAPPALIPPASQILALDLGTTTGWAVAASGLITSGTTSFRPSRYDGGGVRYLRFRHWLDLLIDHDDQLDAVYFEEIRRHAGTDTAHVYGGFLAYLIYHLVCRDEDIANAKADDLGNLRVALNALARNFKLGFTK